MRPALGEDLGYGLRLRARGTCGEDDLGHRVYSETNKEWRMRVSLGLKATFERNIGWDPCPPGGLARGSKDAESHAMAEDKDGQPYLMGFLFNTGGTYQGRVYKVGKYVRCFWTPSAKDLDRLPELGYHVLETIWGDKVWENEGPSSSRYGTATQLPPKAKGAKGIEESVKDIFAVVGLGGAQVCRRARTWS